MKGFGARVNPWIINAVHEEERSWHGADTLRGCRSPSAAMETLDRLQHSLEHAWDSLKHGKADKGTAITVGGSIAVLAGAYYLLRPKTYKKKPGASQLTGGGISRDHVKEEFTDYSKAYGDKPGEGITGVWACHECIIYVFQMQRVHPEPTAFLPCRAL